MRRRPVSMIGDYYARVYEWTDDVDDRISEDETAMHMLTGLNELRKEGRFCDVTLKVGEKTIRAHKIVICVRSPYFMAMFSGNFSESNQQEISIKDVDADSLELLIDYMYTGEINVNRENAKNLLLTASFIQMSSVVEVCSSALRRMMDENNCVECMLIATINSMKKLLNSSIKASVLYFRYIVCKNEYLELEFEVFKQLAQKIVEKAHPGDLIYSFLMRWINHSHGTRINYMHDLLQLVNPLHISPNVLYSLKIGNTSGPIFAAWANRNRLTNGTDDHILVSRRLGTFRPMSVNIFSKDSHCKIEMPPDNYTDGSYVCNGYYIYHQGGWCGSKVLNETFCYHPIRCYWCPFVPLQQARAYHRSCVLNERIFSVGGSDGFKALPSVEFVDLCTCQRGFTNSLPRAKEWTGLGIHENTLYVVGGNERGTAYKCIHRFDVREGVWQELSPSPYRAGASSCAVIEESIYTTHPDTLQRYDIRSNDWAMISAEYNRYPSEVFALNNSLFGLFNDHVARFIPDERMWDIQRMLDCNLPYLQVSTNLLLPSL